MSSEHDYIYATFAYLAWELARWQDVIDWAVGIAGALSLIALNVIRIHKTLSNKSDVEK